MRTDKGFNIPEKTDSPIMWPTRSRRDNFTGHIAFWNYDIPAWVVTGSESVYNSPVTLVHDYGNDWYPITITKKAEK